MRIVKVQHQKERLFTVFLRFQVSQCLICTDIGFVIALSGIGIGLNRYEFSVNITVVGPIGTGVGFRYIDKPARKLIEAPLQWCSQRIVTINMPFPYQRGIVSGILHQVANGIIVRCKVCSVHHIFPFFTRKAALLCCIAPDGSMPGIETGKDRTP
ncbi:hypothetical protein D3C85_1335480 [compost metagenome]